MQRYALSLVLIFLCISNGVRANEPPSEKSAEPHAAADANDWNARSNEKLSPKLKFYSKSKHKFQNNHQFVSPSFLSTLDIAKSCKAKITKVFEDQNKTSVSGINISIKRKLNVSILSKKAISDTPAMRFYSSDGKMATYRYTQYYLSDDSSGVHKMAEVFVDNKTQSIIGMNVNDGSKLVSCGVVDENGRLSYESSNFSSTQIQKAVNPKTSADSPQ